MQRWIWILLIALLIGGYTTTHAATVQASVADSLNKQNTLCTFSPALATVPVYAAPFNDVTQQNGTLSQDMLYPVVARYGETPMYLVSIDTATGWIDGRSGYLNGDCESLPLSDQPLDNFSSVCLFTAVGATPLADTADLLQSAGTLPDGESLPVVWRHNTRYLLRIDDAKSAWVLGSTGTLTGACDDLPSYQPHGEAMTTAQTNVWSLPDVLVGNIMAELSTGIPLMVEAGPVYGPIRQDTDAYGYWYLVAAVGSGETLGWVWEGRINFSDPFPTTNETAITQENTRVWSQPDVYQGVLVTYLPAGISVAVRRGPVSGPIRFDDDTQGDWYWIETGTITGWVWEGRLAFTNA